LIVTQDRDCRFGSLSIAARGTARVRETHPAAAWAGDTSGQSPGPRAHHLGMFLDVDTQIDAGRPTRRSDRLARGVSWTPSSGSDIIGTRMPNLDLR